MADLPENHNPFSDPSEEFIGELRFGQLAEGVIKDDMLRPGGSLKDLSTADTPALIASAGSRRVEASYTLVRN